MVGSSKEECPCTPRDGANTHYATEDYETEHHPLPETTGVQALKYLMEQHGLKQTDLSEIGSQGVVSEILTGKCGR